VNLTDLLSDIPQQRRQNILIDVKTHGFSGISFQLLEYDTRVAKLMFGWRIPNAATDRDHNQSQESQVTPTYLACVKD
jgi:hypothetical protein